MTFAQAYKIAIENSEEFRKHDEAVKAAMSAEDIDCGNGYTCKPSTACLFFSINDESFAYGFDGVTLHRAKHNPKRSEYLITTCRTLEIKK